MIQKFEIRGVHMEVDDNLKKYVIKKIGGLDRYLPQHDRPSAHAEVQLKEDKKNSQHHAICEVTMHLPGDTIVVNEATINIYAAVDIVEAKLKQQLQKHKELHNSGKMRRKVFARFARKQHDEIIAEPS